jgi:hydrogenase-4 component F
MTALLLAPIIAPIVAAIVNVVAGWRRWTTTLTVLSAVTVLACGAALAVRIGSGQYVTLSRQLRADALSATMLIVIGLVGTWRRGPASVTSTPNWSTGTPIQTEHGCMAC